MKSVLNIHWKDWCWSWNSNTLATWCKELSHWKRPWCWERLKAGGEGDDRGWDGWMASLTQWTWVWVNSGSWWWTGKPGVLQSVCKALYTTEQLNWTELNTLYWFCLIISTSWTPVFSPFVFCLMNIFYLKTMLILISAKFSQFLNISGELFFQ